MDDHDVHSLVRTSPKGCLFIGRCFKCGKEGLTAKQMWEPCINPSGMTDAEALRRAIEGETHD